MPASAAVAVLHLRVLPLTACASLLQLRMMCLCSNEFMKGPTRLRTQVITWADVSYMQDQVLALEFVCDASSNNDVFTGHSAVHPQRR